MHLILLPQASNVTSFDGTPSDVFIVRISSEDGMAFCLYFGIFYVLIMSHDRGHRSDFTIYTSRIGFVPFGACISETFV